MRVLPVKSIQVIFDGKVQRVGFRKHAQLFAQELGLKGWVKNLPDGRVELLAEGPSDAVDQLVEKLEDQFQVADIEITERQPVGSEGEFAIKL